MADSFSLRSRRHSLGHGDRLQLALAPDGCHRTVLPGEQYASLKRPWSMAGRPSIMLEGYRPPPEAKIGPRPKLPELEATAVPSSSSSAIRYSAESRRTLARRHRRWAMVPLPEEQNA